VIDFEAALAGLRARFLSRAADDFAVLRRWSDAGAAPGAQQAHILHRLAGAAGTFGFEDLSACAKRAEEALASGAGSPEMRMLLDRLAHVVQQVAP
jgi:HPt (histidine-containing phosphotransfer) domain-containing protein